MILDLSLLFGIKSKIITGKDELGTEDQKDRTQLMDVALPVSRNSAGGTRRRLLERMALGWG